MGMSPRRAPAVPSPAATGDVLVEVSDLRLRRGRRTVLDGVDLELRAGELTAVVGPNGAGKSSLLACVAGDARPQHGAVTLCGRRVGAWSAIDAARRRSVLPQRVSLAFPFSVRDVVEMGRAPWRGTELASDDDEVIDAVLAEVGMDDAAGRSFHELSGGEQARVALARVLAQRTAVLLLDEPTAALDVHHQEEAMALARRRACHGAAVLLIAHDLAAAGAYADQVHVLAGGRVLGHGPPAEAFTSELLSEAYQHPVEVVPDPRTGAPLPLVGRLG